MAFAVHLLWQRVWNIWPSDKNLTISFVFHRDKFTHTHTLVLYNWKTQKKCREWPTPFPSRSPPSFTATDHLFNTCLPIKTFSLSASFNVKSWEMFFQILSCPVSFHLLNKKKKNYIDFVIGSFIVTITKECITFSFSCGTYELLILVFGVGYGAIKESRKVSKFWNNSRRSWILFLYILFQYKKASKYYSVSNSPVICIEGKSLKTEIIELNVLFNFHIIVTLFHLIFFYQMAKKFVPFSVSFYFFFFISLKKRNLFSDKSPWLLSAT